MWGYRRITSFICYYFYKNIILVFTELAFVFFNGFSGQIFFCDWLPTMYNAFFTSWPCLFALAFEQDANEELSYKYPILYKAGQKKKYFNQKVFWTWIVMAMCHGCTAFALPLLGLEGPNDSTGQTKDHWWHSTISFTMVIHIVTYKLFIESNYWNYISM